MLVTELARPGRRAGRKQRNILAVALVAMAYPPLACLLLSWPHWPVEWPDVLVRFLLRVSTHTLSSRRFRWVTDERLISVRGDRPLLARCFAASLYFLAAGCSCLFFFFFLRGSSAILMRRRCCPRPPKCGGARARAPGKLPTGKVASVAGGCCSLCENYCRFSSRSSRRLRLLDLDSGSTIDCRDTAAC